jgi:hypothetical protein
VPILPPSVHLVDVSCCPVWYSTLVSISVGVSVLIDYVLIEIELQFVLEYVTVLHCLILITDKSSKLNFSSFLLLLHSLGGADG